MPRTLAKLLSLLLLLFFISIAALAIHWRYTIQQPLAIAEDGVLFHLAHGQSLTRVAQQLQQQQLLSHPRYFIWLAKLKGNARQVQAGEYFLTKGTTPAQLLQQFTRGDVFQRSFRLVEGQTYRQVRKAMHAEADLKQVLPEMSEDTIIAELGVPTAHAEGYFFPDTYFYRDGASDFMILQRAHKRMVEVLLDSWAERDPALPLKSPYQALILASIIEKETAIDDERPLIAGVFFNRLEKRMRLQTDPTVIYGLGEKFNGNLTRADLRKNTPYNTYVRRGLPPTPISLPSQSSIMAAVKPQTTDALYFVAKPDGSGRHTFSSTLREHNQAVRKWVKAQTKDK